MFVMSKSLETIQVYIYHIKMIILLYLLLEKWEQF